MMLEQEEIDRKYLRMAFIQSEFSYAIRLKVGCVIVKYNKIIGNGCNCMPPNKTYVCEYEKDGREKPCKSGFAEIIRLKRLPLDKLATKEEVVHAEANAIKRASNIALKDATLYVNYSPCKDCARKIIDSGIKRVVYSMDYRSSEGLKMLLNAHIKVDKIEICDF